MIVAGSLIIAGGVAIGSVANGLTADSIVWKRPAQYQTAGPELQLAAVDQTASGQAWARSAFPGGLRLCPDMNPGFLAACETEMKALAERPDFPAGSYGGPLLITRVERIPENVPVARFSDDPEPAYSQPSDTWREADYEPTPEMIASADDPTPDNYPAAPDDE